MKKVVTIGGGTGTFVVLSALKGLPSLSLSAIVSGADDGGSTGRLRDAYGILPVGDARQALVALAADETLRDLFCYRFSKGDIRGHNLGNLLLAALTDQTGSERSALAAASSILRVKGTVLVATDTPATLVAEYEDGSSVRGEDAIEKNETTSRISTVSLSPSVPAGKPVLKALKDADVIVLGPGDLYTSTIAALCADGMREAIQNSSARLVYVLNLFTKTGQTECMRASDFLKEIEKYAGRRPDDVLINSDAFTNEALESYRQEGGLPVEDDLISVEGRQIHRASLASVHVVPALPEDPVRRSLVRHDPEKLRDAFAILLA